MRSSRMLCLLLSVFLCFSSVLFPAAAVGNYWTIDDLEADPLQELEDIKGAGPAADQPAVMSFYEFDDVAPADQLMLFSMNRGVEVAAEEGEVSSKFVGKDFLSRWSTDSLSSLFVEVYYPETTVAGVHIPAYSIDEIYPETGLSFRRSEYSSHFQFLLPGFSIPNEFNRGEVRSINGICFDNLSLSLPFLFDTSDLGDVNSFELSNSFRIVSYVWDESSRVLFGQFPIESLDLLVDGSLVKTFYPESDGFTFNFDYFSFSRSDTIESIVFRLNFSGDKRNYAYTDHILVPYVSLYFDEVTFSVDISEKAFREKVTTGIGNIFQGILELPGKIVNLLVDGLKSLFIPSEDDMTSLTGRYQQLLSERLGFIWQAYELVSNLFTGILDALESGGAYEFSFPGISFPFNGEELVLLPETPVSLENEVMDVIRPVLGTIVCFIAVVGFINVAEGMVMALISGVSYYEFLHGRKGGSG